MYSTHKLEECHTMYDMHAKKKVETSIDQEWTFIINWKKESWFAWYFKNATFHGIQLVQNDMDWLFPHCLIQNGAQPIVAATSTSHVTPHVTTHGRSFIIIFLCTPFPTSILGIHQSTSKDSM
jgi:hypothetical protein